MKQCKGCGAILQSTDKDFAGYTPKAEADYCQRCYRLKHYDDVTVSYRKEINPTEILQQVSKIDALIVWVVDVFDFESNIIEGINRHFFGKEVLLVLTKCDLLPATFSRDKLLRFVYSRLNEIGIQVIDTVVTGQYGKNGVDSLALALDKYSGEKDIVVVGVANAGKSTIINALINSEDTLTISRYPGTTLGFTKLQWNEHTIYDTPGLHRDDSLIFLLTDSELKTLIPRFKIKPRVFQLTSATSFAIGGLVRIDLVNPKTDGTAVIYTSDSINVHRGKVVNADELWKKHYGELLTPSYGNFNDFTKFRYYKKDDAIDVCIYGLGWFCIKGEFEYIDVWTNREVKVTFRRAMI